MKAPSGPIRSIEPQVGDEAQEDSASRRDTVVGQRPQMLASSANAAKVFTMGEPLHQSTNTPTIGAIQGLTLLGRGSRVVNGTNGPETGDSLEDDQSQFSNSSTKQHSFDTKSVASMTTFAMDEKESIRPDDSASVRAVDDEDGNSVSGRNSQFISEPDVVMPALRSIDRSAGAAVHIASRRFQTLTHPPRFGDLEVSPELEARASNGTRTTPQDSAPDDPDGKVSVLPLSPDERLLDALASPKERLSILQLEARLLAFIKQPDIQYIDLPPQNSYARLLAHKLADYYGLQHRINEDGMTIRIFRAEPQHLPTPLGTLAGSMLAGSTQPSQGPAAVKIMRRAGLSSRQVSNTASTAPSSSAPSKATSEAGQSEEGLTSPTESTPGRDKSKMTREEREAQYKAARERIFGDFQELSIGENASTGENSASMSRSSSSSGKKKSRRQKTPKDDSFEARSAFVPSYAALPGMQGQGGYHPAQYLDQRMHTAYDHPQLYYGQMHFGTTPTQAHPGFDSSMAAGATGYTTEPSDWATMQQVSHYGFPPAPARSGHVQINPLSSPINPYGQFPNSQVPQQSWQPPFSPGYQSPMNMPAPAGNWMAPQGYGFGQQMASQQYQPSQPGTSSGPNQASSTGNRSLFNPQTRSFIPSNGSSRTGSRNSTRKKTAAQPSGPAQGRNQNGDRSPHAVQPTSLPVMPRAQEVTTDVNGNGSEESLQKKYGAPANLPKKPPPSQVVPRFEPPG
jgi:hypothetical protein